jgi:cell division protein FtsB
MIKKIRSSFVFKKILPHLRNRYVLTLLGFITWISFFDRNDLISQHSYKTQLGRLRDEKEYYVTEISKSRHDLNDLVSSKKNLEKFARERYLMKKADEDIFIFVEKPMTASN